MEATDLYKVATDWLKTNYLAESFFVEYDVAWTLQKCFAKKIEKYELPFRVFREYPMGKTKRRSYCSDIIIQKYDYSQPLEILIEIKYEPDHNRMGKDLPPNRFHKDNPYVVSWHDIKEDITRITDYVGAGKTKAAYALFIDEGGVRYKNRNNKKITNRDILQRGCWTNWGKNITPFPDLWVLETEVLSFL